MNVLRGKESEGGREATTHLGADDCLVKPRERDRGREGEKAREREREREKERERERERKRERERHTHTHAHTHTHTHICYATLCCRIASPITSYAVQLRFAATCYRCGWRLCSAGAA